MATQLFAHHPIISSFPRTDVEPLAGFRVDFLGVRRRLAFHERLPCDRAEAGPDGLPVFDEEYFEWIDVLESVRGARDAFTMVELGAGYGRWCVRAVAALRAVNPLPYRLVAVEPEPTHFAWMKEHLRENGIDPEAQELIEAAVTDHGRRTAFHIGNAAGWYGQALADSGASGAPGPGPRFLRSLLPRRSRKRRLTPEETAVVAVPSVTLTSILRRLDRVDLIDLDVQGAEADVLRHAIKELDRKVKRLHIGTHGPEIEAELRRLLSGYDWECRNDYPCLRSSLTPYGEIAFNDGVQTWLNPRVGY